MSGSALDEAEATIVVARPPEQPQVTELMREFFAESRRVAIRRQRRLVVTSLVVAVVSITLAVVALVARAEAERQRAEAVRQRDTATSAALASQAENRLATEPDLAALLALEAYRTKDTVDALGSLLRVVDTPTTFVDRFVAHDAPLGVIVDHLPAALVATADDDGRVVLWDVAEDGRATPRAAPIEADDQVTAMAFDESGARLSVATADEGVQLWDLSAEPPAREDHFPLPFSGTALSPDGSLAAGVVQLDDGSFALAITDFSSDLPRAVGSLDLSEADIEQEGVEPTSLVFSPDSSTVAFGFGTEIHVWRWFASDAVDVVDVEGLAIPDRERLALGLTSLTLIDSDRVAFGTEEGTIYLTDLGDDPRSATAVEAFPAATSAALALDSVTATDDQGQTETYLASAHNNGEVKIWFVVGLEAFESASLRGHDEEVLAVDLTPSGAVVSGSFDGDVIWSDIFPSAHIGEPLVEPGALSSHDVDVVGTEFVGPDLVVSLDAFGSLGWWDPATLLPAEGPAPEGVTSIGVAGQLLAVGGEDGSVTLVDAASGESTDLPPGHDAPVVVVAVSLDGTMVVSADDAGTVQLQEIGGAKALEVKTPEAFLPLAFAFPSPEVLWVGGAVDPAEGDTESLALRIDTSTGEVVERVVHNGESGHFVESIALSPDGTRLATGGSDRRIQLWDTADLAAGSAELAGHLDSVADIVFVSDDVMFAGDREGRILMWDLVDARSVGELTGPSDGVASLALDPDGTSLVAGSEDDIVWSWDLEIESWLEGACNLAGRNMTEAEWTRFQLGGEPVRQCPQFGPDQWPAAIYPIDAP